MSDVEAVEVAVVELGCECGDAGEMFTTASGGGGGITDRLESLSNRPCPCPFP